MCCLTCGIDAVSATKTVDVRRVSGAGRIGSPNVAEKAECTVSCCICCRRRQVSRKSCPTLATQNKFVTLIADKRAGAVLVGELLNDCAV